MQFMSERPEFEESDNDATKAAKVKAWLEGVRDDLRPQVNALSEACSEQARQLAADMGEAATDANRIYWGTMGNLLVFGGGKLNTGSPELHALHDLARSVPRRTASQWTMAKCCCEELFDQLDGGETPGLGVWAGYTITTASDATSKTRNTWPMLCGSLPSSFKCLRCIRPPWVMW
jgi:hypothetical protein